MMRMPLKTLAAGAQHQQSLRTAMRAFFTNTNWQIRLFVQTLVLAGFTAHQTVKLLRVYRPNEPLIEPLCVLIGCLLAVGLHLIHVGADSRNRRLMVVGVLAIVVLNLVLGSILPGTSYMAMFSSSAKFNAKTDVSYVALTTKAPASFCRQDSIKFYMQRMDLPLKLAYGVDGSKANTIREMLDSVKQSDVRAEVVDEVMSRKEMKNFKGMVVHSISMRQALLEADDVGNTKWVLSFEDDAKPLPGFARELEYYMTKFESYDIVVLDIRNALSWAFYGGVVGGMAGTLYKTSALPRFIDAVRLDSPLYLKWMESGKTPEFDAFTAWLCNTGEFKCAVAPIVTEAGFVSMNRDVRENRHFVGRED
jgi:hypothetical protein